MANKVFPNCTLGGSNGPGVMCWSSVYGRYFVGAVDTLGNVWVHAYSAGYRLFQSMVIDPVFGIDNHDLPSLLVMDAAGTNPGKVLAVYNHHAGVQYSNLSVNAGDIRSWGTRVQVTASGTGATFQFLFQATDTSHTVFLITSLGTANDCSWGYYTSTDGSTWSSLVPFYIPTGATQPILTCAQDPANPNIIHWFIGTQLATCKIYHIYMEIQSNASVKWFKSDGTDITATLGSGWTDETNFTPVYTTSANAANFCGGVFAGLPAVLYTTTTASGSNSLATWTANLATWSGSAWSSSTITVLDSAGTGAGSYAGPDYLHTGSNVSGYGCLDPNDVTSVYLPIAYAANYSPALPSQETSGGLTDLRLEKWTKTAGTWAKAVDVTGNTSNLNIMAISFQNTSPTQLIYAQGTYTSFSTFNTDLWAHPTLVLNSTKNSTPVWASDVGPLGIQAYYLLYEGTGTTAHDVTGNVAGYNGTFTGTPVWGSDTYGANLGSFSTSNYVAIPGALATAWSNGAYPRYIWFMGANTATTANTTAFLFAQTGANTFNIGLVFNFGSTGVADLYINNNNNTSAVLSQVTDGNPHVWLIVSTSATAHTLYLDGVSKITATSSLAGDVGTLNLLTLGAFKRQAVVSNPWTGSISAFGCGWGANPNPLAFTNDQLTGQFGGTWASFSPAWCIEQQAVIGSGIV